MIEITKEYINEISFNDNSFKNGQMISLKKRVINPRITEDKNLIYCECMGSGNKNYKTSADFLNKDNPIFRCNCPSREIPCKHISALLFHYSENKDLFKIGDIPEDITSKRSKIKKSKEKKETKAKPKINKQAFNKKMIMQLEGVNIVDKFLNEILFFGISSISIQQILAYRGVLKDIEGYYLPLHKIKMEIILDMMNSSYIDTTVDKESYYIDIIKQVIILADINKKAKKTLERAIENNEILDISNAKKFSYMGHIWKQTELKLLGFCKENTNLLNLCTYRYNDDIKKERITVGSYLDSEDGQIYSKINMIPYKALKKAKIENMIEGKILVDNLVIYPNGFNKRVNWSSAISENISQDDIDKIRSYAKYDYKELINEIKKEIKNINLEQSLTALVYYDEIIKIGDDYVIQNNDGEHLILEDRKRNSVSDIKYTFNPDELKNQVIFGMFHYDEVNFRIIFEPMTLINNTEIKKLIW